MWSTVIEVERRDKFGVQKDATQSMLESDLQD